MRKISSELFPCKWVVMSRKYSRGLPRVSRLSETLSRRSLARTSVWMPDSVTSTLAQPTLVLVRGPLYTSTFLDGPSTALRLCRSVVKSVKKESGKDFCLDERFGYIHSCPTNLGTGMRASVHVDLPG